MKGDIYIPIISSILSGGISYYAATVVHKLTKGIKGNKRLLKWQTSFQN